VDYYKKNNAVFDVDANMDADSVKTIVFKELDALIKN
jgi:hypothetical protein